MASIKNIKKDIDYLVDEVISDSLLCMSIQKGKEKEKIIEVINTMVETRNNLISKVNNAPKAKKSSENKAYFKEIYNELLTTTDKSFEKLSKLIETK